MDLSCQPPPPPPSPVPSKKRPLCFPKTKSPIKSCMAQGMPKTNSSSSAWNQNVNQGESLHNFAPIKIHRIPLSSLKSCKVAFNTQVPSSQSFLLDSIMTVHYKTLQIIGYWLKNAPEFQFSVSLMARERREEVERPAAGLSLSSHLHLCRQEKNTFSHIVVCYSFCRIFLYSYILWIWKKNLEIFV